MRGETTEARVQLKALRDVFFNLHKILVESERKEYERVIGPIASPADFVRLLLTDSWFAWLRPYSQLLVVMDETLEKRKPVTGARLADLANQCRALLVVDEHDKGAAGHYYSAMHRDPDVILTHAEVMKALNPRPSA